MTLMWEFFDDNTRIASRLINGTDVFEKAMLIVKIRYYKSKCIYLVAPHVYGYIQEIKILTVKLILSFKWNGKNYNNHRATIYEMYVMYTSHFFRSPFQIGRKKYIEDYWPKWTWAFILSFSPCGLSPHRKPTGNLGRCGLEDKR